MDKTATYRAFYWQIHCTAYQLRQQIQSQPRQVVAITASSCIEYILVAQAVWWAGGIVCPINNTLHPGGITKALDLLKPDYLVVDASMFVKVPAIMQKSKQCKISSTFQIRTIGKDTNGSSWPAFPITFDNEQQPELPNPILSKPVSVQPSSSLAAQLVSSKQSCSCTTILL